MIGEDPLLGVGIGGQPRASRELAGSDRPTANFVSHTTPLTVAAELGAVGLALYLWLLVGGVRLIAAVYGAASAPSGSRSAPRSSPCSCTRSSTAASSRTRSPGWCSRWPRAG